MQYSDSSLISTEHKGDTVSFTQDPPKTTLLILGTNVQWVINQDPSNISLNHCLWKQNQSVAFVSTDLTLLLSHTLLSSSPDFSVSVISPIHGLSLPQTVKSENFISNEYIFFHVVPRNIKQQRLRKSHVLGPLETALLDVPTHKHILRPNIQPGFILLISSGLSLYHSGFLINMSCNTKSSLIEV